MKEVFCSNSFTVPSDIPAISSRRRKKVGEIFPTSWHAAIRAEPDGKIGEIVAVTTRYFGGIKLGTGGLVRAYQGGVAQALELLPVKEKIIPVFLRVETDYARLNRIKRVLSDMDASIAEELFAENVCLTVSLSEELAEACKQALMQVSDGTARISACERYEAEE